MNLRNKVMILGGVVGALVGVFAAQLYLREAPLLADESGNEKLPEIRPADALAVSLGVLTAIRGIVGLGRPK